MHTDTRTNGSSQQTPGEEVSTVGIIGFGTMGSGIAHVCALAGLTVKVVETSQETIDRDMQQIARYMGRAVEKGRMSAEDRDAAMDRIQPDTELSHVFDADLVIEAVTERVDVKQSVFRTLDAEMPAHAILATNTSAISVTEIAAATQHPERVCGLHFFNPAPVLPLVEVIKAERTSDETADRAYRFVQQIGKQPVSCGDTPGFVVNRILIPLMNDIARVHEAGTASAEDIDKACRYGLNWPIGPLALVDLIGIDVHVHASEAIYEAYREPRFAPPASLVRMVKAGKLGRKSGEGFYKYDES